MLPRHKNLSLTQRLSIPFQLAVLRALKFLPDWALNRIETIDRSGMDHHMRRNLAFLIDSNLFGDRFTIEGGSPERGRDIYANVIMLGDPPWLSLSRVVDHQIKMEDGDEILVRRYCPAQSSPQGAALLFLHGGAFILGSVEVYDHICRYMANHIGVTVLSVDYRMAPEHPAPCTVNDALASWRWLLENAAELGLNPKRLGVMGDSAGGFLAGLVTQQAKQAGLQVPALTVLACPYVDGGHVDVSSWPSMKQFGKGFGLDLSLLTWCAEIQFRGRQQEMVKDERLRPLYKQDLSGLSPFILLTAGFDPLHDQGLEYGEKLRAAGVDVTSLHYPELPHPFFIMTGIISAGKEALDELCDKTALLLRRLH